VIGYFFLIIYNFVRFIKHNFLSHARPEDPLWCILICAQTKRKRGLKCFISPTNHITGN
jgi:hypothetical protein